MASVRDRVIDIIVEQLSVDRDKVVDAASFIDDLGADSLDTAELVMGFEDEFDIEIPDTETSIKKVGDAISFIESKQ